MAHSFQITPFTLYCSFKVFRKDETKTTTDKNLLDNYYYYYTDPQI